MKDIGHLIGGQRVGGGSGQFGPVFNPAPGEQTGRVALAGAAEVDAAVQAARQPSRLGRHAAAARACGSCSGSRS